MYRLWILAAAIVATSTFTAPEAAAQVRSVLVTPTFGYQFGGELAVDLGRLELASAPAYGGTVEFEVKRDSYVTLLYSRQDTNLNFRSGLGSSQNVFDISTTYLQLGGTNIRDLGGAAKPFGTFTMGAVRFNPDDSAFGDEWKFAMVMGFGVQVELNEKIQLRTQFRAPITVLWSSANVFCGTGSGCYTGLTTSGMAQGEFSGGLSFVF